MTSNYNKSTGSSVSFPLHSLIFPINIQNPCFKNKPIKNTLIIVISFHNDAINNKLPNKLQS